MECGSLLPLFFRGWMNLSQKSGGKPGAVQTLRDIDRGIAGLCRKIVLQFVRHMIWCGVDE